MNVQRMLESLKRQIDGVFKGAPAAEQKPLYEFIAKLARDYPSVKADVRASVDADQPKK